VTLLRNRQGIANTHRAAHRVDRARKLSKHRVAHRLEETTLGLRYLGVGNRSASGHTRGGSLLVGPHQTGVANDISDKDCRKPPLHADRTAVLS
jgi:hypothetical protein